MDQPSQPVPEPRTADEEISSRASMVQGYLFLALALAVPISQPLGLLTQLPAVVAPWLVAMVFLWIPTLRQAGFTIAWCTSAIALLPLIPFTAIGWVAAGFMAPANEWAAILAAMALTPVMIVVAVQSWRALRRFDPERTSNAPFAAGIATMFFFLFLAAAVRPVDEQAAAWQRTEIPAADINARKAATHIAAIAACAADYAARSTQQSFPRTLTELSAGDQPCLDGAVAAGEADGYRYHYYPALPDANGVVRVYAACAEPIDEKTGSATFVVDATEPSPQRKSPPEGRSTAIKCSEAWRSALNSVRFCAAQYAARNPLRGYPASLREIGLSGTQCLGGPRDKAYHLIGDNSWYWYESIRVMYIAGKPDSAGRITDYEVHINHPGREEGNYWNELADSYGSVHVGKWRRLATARDATSQQGGVTNYFDEKIAGFLCTVDGVVEACPVEAARLMSEGHVARARAMYEQACVNGSGAACLWMARQMTAPEQVVAARSLISKACELGEPAACGVLADQVRGADPAAAQRLDLLACAVGPIDKERCKTFW